MSPRRDSLDWVGLWHYDPEPSTGTRGDLHVTHGLIVRLIPRRSPSASGRASDSRGADPPGSDGRHGLSRTAGGRRRARCREAVRTTTGTSTASSVIATPTIVSTTPTRGLRCFRLPSDPASRRTPLPSANRSPCRSGGGNLQPRDCLPPSEAHAGRTKKRGRSSLSAPTSHRLTSGINGSG